MRCIVRTTSTCCKDDNSPRSSILEISSLITTGKAFTHIAIALLFGVSAVLRAQDLASIYAHQTSQLVLRLASSEMLAQSQRGGVAVPMKGGMGLRAGVATSRNKR